MEGGGGGGGLGDLVEMARVVGVGWYVLVGKRWDGMGRGVVVGLRVVDFGLLFLVGKGAGGE